MADTQITEVLPDLPDVASKYNEQFLEDMDQMLDVLPTWSTRLNSLVEQINNFRGWIVSQMQFFQTVIDKANDIKGYVIPTEATYPYATIDKKDNDIVSLNSNGYGYLNRIDKKDRWLETDTPNVIVDKFGGRVRFGDGIYELESNSNVELPQAPFAPNTTDELLDYSINGVTTQVAHSKGDIVVCGNDTLENEKIYQAITDTSANDLLTDTTKFKPIDYVTRQDVVVLVKDTENKEKAKYKTIKGYEIFSKSDAYADSIASRYNFSKIGNGLYSDDLGDGVEEFVIVGLVSRLNAGAYHPVYNVMGCARIDNTSQDTQYWWYQTEAYPAKSIYDVIFYMTRGSAKGTISSNLSGRPDGRFYDKIYYEGLCGFIFIPTYATKESKTDLLAEFRNKLVSGDTDLALDEDIETLITYVSADDFVDTGYNGSNGTLLTVTHYINTYTTTTSAVSGITIVNKQAYFVNNGKAFRLRYIRNYGTNTYLYGFLEDGDWTSQLDTSLPCVVTDSIETSYLLTQGTSTTTDVIGNPDNYPQDWKDYLASGKSLPLNPLLVNQDGTTAVPKDTNTGIILSKKTISAPTYLKTSDYGDIYIVDGTIIRTTNSFTISATTDPDVYIVNYQSSNKPLIEADPLPISLVDNKVIASNSHSWYKGAGLVNAVTGKVSVGNGVNGLESKYLENGEIDENKLISIIPQHSTIQLDNSNSPTAKCFFTLAEDTNKELVIQVEGKEIIEDSGYGDNNKFDQLTNGTQTDLNGNTIKTTNAIIRTGVFAND